MGMSPALSATVQFVFANIGKEDPRLLAELLKSHASELANTIDQSWHMQMVKRVNDATTIAELVAVENHLAARRDVLAECLEEMA